MNRRFLFSSDESRRIPNRRSSWRDVDQNNRSSTYFSSTTDLDVPENSRSSSDQATVTDLGMSVSTSFTRSTERHVVEDRNVVPYHSCFSDDNSGCVIEEYTFPDLRCWMDIDGEHFGDTRVES